MQQIVVHHFYMPHTKPHCLQANQEFSQKIHERFRKMFDCLTSEETTQFFGLLEKMIKG